jgi:hypothetical protein
VVSQGAEEALWAPIQNRFVRFGSRLRCVSPFNLTCVKHSISVGSVVMAVCGRSASASTSSAPGGAMPSVWPLYRSLTHGPKAQVAWSSSDTDAYCGVLGFGEFFTCGVHTNRRRVTLVDPN